MSEYIERNLLIKRRHGCNRKCSECDFAQDGDSWCQGELFVVDVLAIPAADVVSRGAYDQCDWERVVALTQLKEIGKGLGERMDDVRPVVRCRDCVNYGEMLSGYDHRLICHKFALTTKPNFYCACGERRNCGARMKQEVGET